jgi:hypothetical protein
MLSTMNDESDAQAIRVAVRGVVDQYIAEAEAGASGRIKHRAKY